MTFTQLQYLLEAYNTGSVSQAAKNLFVSQPSLSLTLKSLEEELGYPIFQRTKNGLVPTAQGINVIEHASRIFESYQYLTTPSSLKTTFVRISAASVLPIQKAFTRLVGENIGRRDISLSMTQETNCADGLRNFTLEAGFRVITEANHLRFVATVQKYGLQVKLLATLPGMIRIGKKHPLFYKKDLVLADFENYMFLDSTDSTVSQALLNAGVTKIKPNHNIISSQHYVRKELVRQGYVYDISFFFPNEMDTENYRYILLPSLKYNLVAMTNPLHVATPELDRLMELVQEELHAAGL